MSDQEFYGIYDNGGVTVGLVAGNDAFSITKEGVYRSNEGTADCTVKTFGDTLNKLTPNMRVICHAAVLFCLKLSNEAAHALTKDVMSKEKAAVSMAAKDFMKGSTISPQEAMRLAVSLIIATKVNWWMTNHHTGVPVPQGYVKKMLEATAANTGYDTVGPAGVDAFNNCIWRIGHWFDTRVMLAAMGIAVPTAHAEATRVIRSLLVPAADLLLRINAPPAGTAKVFDCISASRMLSGSVYSMVIPKPSDINSLLATARLVRAGPASFHEGAQYLTGAAKTNINQPEQDTIDNLGVYLAVIRPNHTLKRAACFSRITADSNKELAMSLAKVSKAISESKASQEQIDAMISKGEAWEI